MRSSAAATLCIDEKPIWRHSSTLPERGIHLRWTSSSSRWRPWRGGSSPPSGLSVCTSSYVFNLSLSRVLDMSWSWCITGFVNIVGSYDVIPLLSCCDELNLSLWDIVMLDWILDLRTLDICLACGYPWWQWGVLLIHLIYVLVLNLRIPAVTLG